jgi:hypothetical protein
MCRPVGSARNDIRLRSRIANSCNGATWSARRMSIFE